MKKQVDRLHYDFLKYTSIGRWNSYYWQIFEILKSNPKNILEVGAGTRLVGDIISKNEIEYYSCDIASDLQPDYIQSVDSMNINKKFDVVCAFQVLEHLPFKKFEKNLLNLKRHSNKCVLISLPDCRPNLKVKFKIPGLREISFTKKIPHFKKIKFNGEHYWEVGGKDTKPSKVINLIKNHFKIKKMYHVPENPYHLMFVLENNRV